MSLLPSLPVSSVVAGLAVMGRRWSRPVLVLAATPPSGARDLCSGRRVGR
jgi:hypothetical protein